MAILSFALSQVIVLYMGNVVGSAGMSNRKDLVALLHKLRADESFYHLMLCFGLWWQAKYVLLFLLVPFVVFAFYHVVFTVRDLLVAGNGTKQQNSAPVQFERLFAGMKALQPLALSIVAWFELAAVPYVLVQWMHGNASFSLVVLAGQTTRNLYAINARTRLAFKQLRTFTDRLVVRTKFVPLRLAYGKCVRLIEKCAPQ